MSETRMGFWVAGTAGLAMLASACGGAEILGNGLTPEELDRRIAVSGYTGFEDQAVNEWQYRHPDERLTGLQAIVEHGQFIGYIAVTQKNTKGTGVRCERLALPDSPDAPQPFTAWHERNNARSAAKKRTEIFHEVIPNQSATVGTGYILCSLPFRQQPGVK